MDTTASVLRLPGDITTEATGPEGAEAFWSAPASDIIPRGPAVTCTKGDPPVELKHEFDRYRDTFPIGTTTVTCSATDTAGNEATASFMHRLVRSSQDSTYSMALAAWASIPGITCE